MKLLKFLIGMTVTAVTVLAAVAQIPAQKPAFEVVSIKLAVFPSDAYFAGVSDEAGCTPARVVPSGNRLTFSRVNVCSLIAAAFDMKDYLVVADSNPWIKNNRDRSIWYEIQATAPEALTAERAQVMLQALLADRFQLRVHKETKELPVYVLAIAKSGPKLTLSADGACATALRTNPNVTTIGGMGGRMASCKPTTSVTQLADRLSRFTDRPVLDRSGITGGQVFELQWAAGTQSDGPSLFTAVQEQLGLRLEATKASVEVLVIDSVQKPSEN